MKAKSNQETFDFVVGALVKQGKPSYGRMMLAGYPAEVGGCMYRGPGYPAEVGGCMYRGPEGTKCAAGHCIPDEAYRPSMENAIASSASVRSVLEAAGYDVGFLSAMQRAHDDAANVTGVAAEEWLHDFLLRARRVAVTAALSTEVVDLAEAALASALDDA